MRTPSATLPGARGQPEAGVPVSDPALSHAALIDVCGGATAVARLCGISRVSVQRWKTRGIPARRWAAVAARCREMGFAIDLETLAAGRPGT